MSILDFIVSSFFLNAITGINQVKSIEAKVPTANAFPKFFVKAFLEFPCHNCLQESLNAIAIFVMLLPRVLKLTNGRFNFGLKLNTLLNDKFANPF